jgi:hypothetical protein
MSAAPRLIDLLAAYLAQQSRQSACFGVHVRLGEVMFAARSLFHRKRKSIGGLAESLSIATSAVIGAALYYYACDYGELGRSASAKSLNPGQECLARRRRER